MVSITAIEFNFPRSIPVTIIGESSLGLSRKGKIIPFKRAAIEIKGIQRYSHFAMPTVHLGSARLV